MKLKTSLYTAVIVLALPAAAHAQACIGLPIKNGQTALAANLSFPPSATSYGVGVEHRPAGPLGFGAEFSLTSPSGGGSNMTTFGVRGVLDLQDMNVLPKTSAASVCPNVGFSYSKISDVNEIEIPFGVGLGTQVALGAGSQTSLLPYVVPQFVWSRVSANGESASDTNFAIQAGANVAFSRYFVGGSIGKVMQEGSDAVFGITAGIVF